MSISRPHSQALSFDEVKVEALEVLNGLEVLQTITSEMHDAVQNAKDPQSLRESVEALLKLDALDLGGERSLGFILSYSVLQVE